MEISAYRMLYDSIHEFKATAAQVESEITRRGIQSEGQEVAPATGGRTHHDIWVSMKTVSHFNLGVSLELMLKLLVFLNNKNKDPIPNHHCLIELLDAIPEKYRKLLEATFQDCMKVIPDGFEPIAFINSASPDPLDYSPPNRDVGSLRGFLEYLDQDAMLHLKRYSYELVEQDQFRHYLSDISVFVKFIDRVMRDIERF